MLSTCPIALAIAEVLDEDGIVCQTVIIESDTLGGVRCVIEHSVDNASIRTAIQRVCSIAKGQRGAYGDFARIGNDVQSDGGVGNCWSC